MCEYTTQFLFLSFVQVFSSTVSLIYRLKYPCSCFSFYFCFLAFVAFLFGLTLPYMLLAAVINYCLYVYLFGGVVLFFGGGSFCLVIILLRLHSAWYWRFLYLLFLTHIICQCHLFCVRPCVSSSIFLSLGWFV